jgi:hypothetical protein
VPSYRSMSFEDRNCHFYFMPTLLKQVINSFLTWSAYKKLAVSMTWHISPGIHTLLTSPDNCTMSLYYHQFHLILERKSLMTAHKPKTFQIHTC